MTIFVQSGTLDRNEMELALTITGFKDIDKAIDEMDNSGDGEVDWKEFKAWFIKT